MIRFRGFGQSQHFIQHFPQARAFLISDFRIEFGEEILTINPLSVIALQFLSKQSIEQFSRRLVEVDGFWISHP
jgi:hypothetical protein